MDMYQKREMRKNKKMDESTKSLPSTSINWYPGHMAKTKRLIKENLKLIDLVFELIDSRMPNSSKIKDIDELIKDKLRIMIMTKYDLCDKEETNKWVKYYEEKGYIVLKYDLIKDNINSIYSKVEEIMNDFNINREEKNLLKRKYRALIIGIPNVGKSTLINKIVGKRSTKVGNMPGVTKDLNWIRSNSKIELLDSPGLLYPNIDNEEKSFNLASLSSIKEEILPIDEVSIFVLNKLNKFYPKILKEIYNLDNIDNVEESIYLIGKNRGCLIKGGEVDYNKVYKLILKDIRDGKIKNITFDRYGE
ncbi:MAG: ribosome biogenesis GTPase YlqF [Bacilli bacterium]|nr:ribosome biogenesis GTPase YlqF [Bacilli bacterium]